MHPIDSGVLVADWVREQDTCQKCGRPMSVCSDPNLTFYPQRTVCYADMATSWVRWKYDQLHGSETHAQFHDGTFKAWSKHRSDAFPYAADDGISLWVATEDLTPDDDFLGGGD